jgi:ABC-2 type transport system ATP-binding protein
MLATMSASPILTIRGLTKTYASGHQALKGVDLDIERGEIFALLGPNGAGKTTLIGVICGLVNATAGSVVADGFDLRSQAREARRLIGLVPQELTTDAFETPWATVNFSRGLFGCKSDPALVERVLRRLSLWDKKDSRIMTLSGGMKRRVMIAKALSHEPRILFLDEPSAGVDVELRRDMWDVVRGLRDAGVTIILTTHYIQEAEEMADRVGVINKGELVLVDEKAALMHKLGHKQLILHLQSPLTTLPPSLAALGMTLLPDCETLSLSYDADKERPPVAAILRRLEEDDIAYRDLETRQSSLEEIFVNLVREPRS